MSFYYGWTNLVLDEGRIVGKRNTHGELMHEMCQVYQEIAYSQLSKEELSLSVKKKENKASWTMNHGMRVCGEKAKF